MVDSAPILVDPEVSRAKLARQLQYWDAEREEWDRRGYFITHQEDLRVTVAFAARVVMQPALPAIPLVLVNAEIDFANYDLWAPSVKMVGFLSRTPSIPPIPIQQVDNGQPVNVLLTEHPVTGLPFLCLRGIREYHVHPQHSGDDWLLYRDSGHGTLISICDAIWKFSTRRVGGLGFNAINHPILGPQFQPVLLYNFDELASLPLGASPSRKQGAA